MNNITFGSTYKIPMSQWGINNTKKLQLKNLVSSFNGVVTKGKDSFAVVSIPDKKDIGFMRKLAKIGSFQYEMFEGEKIPKDSLLSYIKNARKI